MDTVTNTDSLPAPTIDTRNAVPAEVSPRKARNRTGARGWHKGLTPEQIEEKRRAFWNPGPEVAELLKAREEEAKARGSWLGRASYAGDVCGNCGRDLGPEAAITLTWTYHRGR